MFYVLWDYDAYRNSYGLITVTGDKKNESILLKLWAPNSMSCSTYIRSSHDILIYDIRHTWIVGLVDTNLMSPRSPQARSLDVNLAANLLKIAQVESNSQSSV
jgi:hypothetical protein